MIERKQLRERPARRTADHVRRPYAVGTEHSRGIRYEIGARVARATGRVADRAAGVAMVVAHHEPPAIGEQSAHAVLPPEHRRADAHDEQYRRIGRVTEGLGAQLD